MQTEFVIEEADIVKLVGTKGDFLSGWINIGSHALQIELNPEGNLRVESYARTNEGGRMLGLFTVSKQDVVDAGGADPGEGESDDEGDEGWKHIIVDGVEYVVEVEDGGDKVSVYTIDIVDRSPDDLVAEAMRDSAFETVYYGQYGNGEDGVEGQLNDLYDKPVLEIATWLVATHPCFG